MSKAPVSLSLDFHQWGAVLCSDLVRLGNFISNFTNSPERFGPVDASVLREFHDHLDKMKVMSSAWAVAYQKMEQSQSQTVSSSKIDQPQSSSTFSNGAPAPKLKGKPGRPKKKDVEKRARLAPRPMPI